MKPQSRVHELVARYGSDRALGVTYDDDEGVSLLPDGGHASSCGDCAHYIRTLEPNTAVYGFWSKDNPSWAGAQLVDGHDFAVVDERYIVDPWIVETEALSKRSVFDLQEPSDRNATARIYGDRTKWRLVAPPRLP